MTQLMGWFWRRPPKGKRPKGKLYQSTQQAMNELRRASLLLPENSSVRLWTVALNIDGKTYEGTLPAKSFLQAQALADSINGAIQSEAAIGVATAKQDRGLHGTPLFDPAVEAKGVSQPPSVAI